MHSTYIDFTFKSIDLHDRVSLTETIKKYQTNYIVINRLQKVKDAIMNSSIRQSLCYDSPNTRFRIHCVPWLLLFINTQDIPQDLLTNALLNGCSSFKSLFCQAKDRARDFSIRSCFSM